MERIEHYTDYRDFLKDYYKERKKQFKYFSYRYFCKKAGLTSPSLLKEVMEGKRGLTLASIKSFIQGLGLTEMDGRYFTALVFFTQAKSPKERQEYLNTLRQYNRKVTEKVVPLDWYAYYSKWYHPVIRELACLVDWKENYDLLAKSVNPPVTPREAKESVQFLIKIGMLLRTKEGRYVQAHPAQTTGSEVMSTAVRELNRQMAELGERAIRQIPPSLRDNSSMTLGFSQKNYQKAKQEIREFKDRLKSLAHDDADADTVYNLNVHLFPVSNGPKKSRDSE